MLAILLAAGAAASPQTAPSPTAPPQRVRDEVVALLRTASRPVRYDVRRTAYHVDWTADPELRCQLLSILQSGLRDEPPAIGDLLGRLERSLPLELATQRSSRKRVAQGPVGVTRADDGGASPSLQRISERGGRSLRQWRHVGPQEGSRLLIDRSRPDAGREMRWDAPSRTLLFGPPDSTPSIWDSAQTLGALSLQGQLGHQLPEANWKAGAGPGSGATDGAASKAERVWLVRMESQFRLVEYFVQLDTSSPARPVHGYLRIPRDERAAEVAWLLEWSELDGAPFVTETLRVVATASRPKDEALLLVSHIERTAVRFDVNAEDLILEIPEPRVIKRAKGGDWNMLRPFQELPPGWGSMVQIRDQ